MSVMVETQVLQALQTATIAAVAASSMPTLPIRFVGRILTVPDDNRYLEIVHIPNNPWNEFWGSSKTYQGIYRQILHWGVNDAGAYAPLNVLASIAEGFAKGSVFASDNIRVKIDGEPDLSSIVEQAPELLFSVSIRYTSFQP